MFRLRPVCADPQANLVYFARRCSYSIDGTLISNQFDKPNFKSRKENPQKLTQLSSRSHQDTSWEKEQHKKTPS